MRYVKLQQPPRRRMRVREVAKELGVTSIELLERLREMKEYVNSLQQFLEVPTIRNLHDTYGVSYAEPAESSSRSPTQAPYPPTGLTAPRPQATRNNHPLASEPARTRATDSTKRQGRGFSGGLIDGWTSAKSMDAYAVASGSEAAPAWEYPEWQLKGFTETERDVWIAAGLRPSQAKWAAALRDAGLTPVDLAEDLNGWTVLARLQKGEGAAAVARLLKEARKARAG